MRRNKFSYVLLAALMLGGLSLTSCNDDDNVEAPKETTSPLDGDNVEVEVTATEEMTAEKFADKIFNYEEGSNANEDDLVAARTEFLRKVREKEDEAAKESGMNGLATTIIHKTFRYRTVDQNGSPIWLTGKVLWGTFGVPGSWFEIPLDPDNIYLCEHYTIMSDAEAPSNSTSLMMSIYNDNLVIMPDYIGFGETKSLQQTYLAHDLIAQNSIDALKAGYAVFENSKQKNQKLEDDWKLYVIGASQGAGNALAVHKYFDTHTDFADKWHFAYSYCCSGPYSPRVTLQKMIENNEAEGYLFPIVLTIKSMLYCYPDIMKHADGTSIKEEEFYSEAYLKVKSEIDEMMESKNYKSVPINDKIKTALGGSTLISSLMSKEGMDANSDIIKALLVCLDKNDLTTGWTPIHKIKLYSSKEDKLVPYANVEALKAAFGDKVEEFFSYGINGHVSTCAKWMATLATGNW